MAIRALALRPSDLVLELGFGPGCAVQAMTPSVPRGRVEGVDQSERMLRQAVRRNRRAIASGRVALVRGAFNPLPWAEGSFDKILLANVAYFLDRDGRDIAEAYRVLKPTGRMVVYVTARETMKHWPFSGPESHRTFDVGDLGALLRQAGFEQSAICIQELRLPLGIVGLLATAKKSERSNSPLPTSSTLSPNRPLPLQCE